MKIIIILVAIIIILVATRILIILGGSKVLILKQIKALCYSAITVTLLINFGFAYVLQYTTFILNFSALHFMRS